MLLTWGYTVVIDTNRGEEPNNRPEPRKGVKFEPVFLQNRPEPGGVDTWRVAAVCASTGRREPQHRGGKTVQNREARHQSKGRAHCSPR